MAKKSTKPVDDATKEEAQVEQVNENEEINDPDAIMAAMNANAAEDESNEVKRDEEKTEVITAPPSDDKRAALSKKYDKKTADEARGDLVSMTDPENEVFDGVIDKTLGNEPQDEATETDETVQEATETDNSGEQLVTIKVNGVEQQVSQADLIKHYQMNQAADQKLDAAKNFMATLKEQAAQVQIPSQPLPAAQTPDAQVQQDVSQQPAQPVDQSQPQDDDIDFVKVAETLQVGDEKEAAEMLQQVFDKYRNPQNPAMPSSDEDIKHLVSQELTAQKEQQESEEALQRFITTNPDIYADRGLRAMTLENLFSEMYKDFLEIGMSNDELMANFKTKEELAYYHAQLRQSGQFGEDFRGHDALLDAAGNATREWAGQVSQVGQSGGKPAPTKEDRQAAKNRIAPQPAGRGQQAQPAPRRPTTQQTRRDAVRAAIAARGQAVG